MASHSRLLDKLLRVYDSKQAFSLYQFAKLYRYVRRNELHRAYSDAQIRLNIALLRRAKAHV